MRERILALDAIRGVALFGILIVNIRAFASVYYGSGIAPPGGLSPVDSALAFLVSALFEMKFYLLFSFLFGYSVTLQIRSAGSAGVGFVPRIVRRQAGLFAIGAFHGAVLFHGDILTTYAVLGLVLLAVRDWRETTKLRIALGLLAATALVWALLAIVQAGEPGRDDSALFHEKAALATAAFRGPPPAIVTRNLAALAEFVPMLLLLQAPCALAMFLFGFVAGERRLFANPGTYRPYLGPALRWGLGIGLPGALLYATATQTAPGAGLETAALALSILTAPFLATAFVALILMWVDAGSTQGWREALACAGRMALSNYLLQSLVCAVLFYGFGFGLIGRLSLGPTLLIACVIYSCQLLASRWWLARFRYGPLEWLLRAITIAGLPRLRLTSQEGSVA